MQVMEAKTAPKNADRRIVRTRRLLRDALSELIEEKGFDRITVCDLTERADINRGTFYAHYKDKTDLLQQSENEIIEELTTIQFELSQVTLDELVACYLSNTPLPFIVRLYDYLRENGAFVRALVGPKGDPAFMPRLREIICGNVVNNVLNDKYREPSTLTNYYIAYYAMAQIGIVEAWLQSGMKESSEEMALIVMSIMFMRPGDAIAIHEKGKLPVNDYLVNSPVAATWLAETERELS